MKTYAKGIILGAVICLIVGVAGLYNIFRSANGFAAELDAVNEDRTFPGSAINTVSVSSSIFDVTAVPAPNDDIRVQWQGQLSTEEKKRFRMETTVRNGSLEVRINPVEKTVIGLDVGMLLNFAFAKQDRPVLKIALPAKLYKTIEIKCDTGDVKVESLSAESLKAETATGDIEIRDSKGDRIVAQADTGDISLKQVEGEMKLTADTGDITGEFGELQHNVTAQTDTGDIRLEAKAAPRLSVNLRNDVGDVTANVPGLQVDVKDKHQLKGKSGMGGPSINMRSDTGDVELTVQQ